jgi:hypothetical protein
VVQGLVGEPPKTAWVIGYPLLERIYYLLVAGYDVWGNTPHQLETRLYMDFLRMEGEANFLMLLPRDQRAALRDHWYRGADDQAKARVHGSVYRFDGETGVPTSRVRRNRSCSASCSATCRRCWARASTSTASPMPCAAPGPAATGRRARRQPVVVAARRCCCAWTRRRPAGPALLQRAAQHRPPQRVTLLRESACWPRSEHTLTVVPGFIGAYPNAMMHSTVAELPALARACATLASRSRLPRAGRPPRHPPHRPRLLGRQRCADAGLPAMGTGRGRLAGLRAAAEPLSGPPYL